MAHFLNIVNSPFKFKWFLFTKLPAAYFSGIKLIQAKEQSCLVTIQYKWLTKNPFKSIYFASLSMAAEMCSGVLAMANIYDRKIKMSMLVTKLEAEFIKKATGVITFTCLDGNAIRKAVEEAQNTNESVEFKALSKGTNSVGEPVANFYITWSFKKKIKPSK